MEIQFEDNSIKVINALKGACIKFLEEAAGELESQTKRKTPEGTWYSEIKNKWEHEVDESKLEATVGNPLEASLWVEFGTGEFAANGDGRKGYWVYVKGSDSGLGTSYAYNRGKHYTLAEAKRIVRFFREKGLDAHYTKGQMPKRPFEEAFTTMKPKIKHMAEEILGGDLK